jgi:hypothetical protein
MAYGVTIAAVGQTIEIDGTLSGVVCTTPPPPGGWPEPPMLNPSTGVSTRRYFTLVDDGGPGQPRQLINVDPYTSPIQRGGVLLSNAIPFKNLTVGSCPPGSQWTVSTLAQPRRERREGRT